MIKNMLKHEIDRHLNDYALEVYTNCHNGTNSRQAS
jgi:hypothetical protein